MNKQILRLRLKVRDESPLIHHITNYVVMNVTANVTLAVGASPVMAHAEEEVDEMAAIASALVLNIGTLSERWITAMFVAARRAKKRGIPIILDPVGSGATKLRTDTSRRLLAEFSPAIVRGNSSEMLSLMGSNTKTKGVDSVHHVEDVCREAMRFAADRGIVVAVTGPVDFITDGHIHYHVHNGHEMLSRVTGTGCSATSVIGAFAAVSERNPACYALAAAGALGYYGLAAEMASRNSGGPGSFGTSVIDWLYLLDDEQILEGLRVVQTS